MKKTLGQIAYESLASVSDGYWPSWDILGDAKKQRCEHQAEYVKRAVLRELRREGRLGPTKQEVKNAHRLFNKVFITNPQ